MNALGDLTKTNTLFAEQLGSEAVPIDNAYITNIIPPIATDTLQQVCDTGNTTNTDIEMNGGTLNLTSGNVKITTGSLISNTIDPASGTITTFSRQYRGDVDVQTMSVAGAIDDQYVRGDCIQIRNGTASGIFVLPRGDAGNHFWFVNSSGNAHRLTAAPGGTLDGVSPPNFIVISAGQPAAIKLLCVRTNEWYSSNV